MSSLKLFGRNASQKESEPTQYKKKQPGEMSRRTAIKFGFFATGAVALKIAEAEAYRIQQLAALAGTTALEVLYHEVSSQRIILTAQDIEPTPIMIGAPNTFVVMGNSLPAGYEQSDGKTLAQRVAENASRNLDYTIGASSGAVPGSLPGEISGQYRKIRRRIPKGDQHIIIQADDNAANAHPEAIRNLQALAQNPAQPGRLLTYYLQRKKVIDDLENSLRGGVLDIIKAGGSDIKSIKLIGPAPTHKAKRIQQVIPGRKPRYMDIAGNSPEAIATQTILADYEHEAMKATQRVASELRRTTGIQITVMDIRDYVNASNYHDSQHYDKQAAEVVAGRIAGRYRRGHIE